MKVVDFKVPQTTRVGFRFQHDALPYFYDKLHHHSEWQLMLIVAGAGTLIAGDYVGRFESGDLFFIASNQPHVFRCDEQFYQAPTRLCESISVYFDENYLGTHFWSIEEIEPTKVWLDGARCGYRMVDQSKEIVSEKIKRIARQNGLDRLISFFEILRIIVASSDLKKLSVMVPPDLNRNREGKRMNDILQFTFSESHRKIYLDEVAQVAHLSVEAFCRYFKTRTGKTYTSFLNEVRISNACKLLIQTEKSIQEVCYDSGFINLSNFNRIFKKVTGHRPSQYLRSL